MNEDDVNENDEAASQDAIDDIFGDSDGTETATEGESGMNLNDINDVGSSSDEGGGFEHDEAMAEDVTAIYDIPVQISAVLGRSTMQVSQLLKLGRGAVVELDRKVGEAIDIYVNNRLVARGEVVVVEDKLGVTMTEIVKSDRGG